MDDRHIFTKAEVESILNECHGKTLEEIDSAHVLQVSKKGNKGYPGAIIEQSVLGYPADNKARPDLLIDGVEVELKTTGIYERGKGKDTSIEAKQPVSITGVKPSQIVNEDFESSVFWHKCAHLLFVYYWYAHYATPKDPSTYADFPIMNHQFVDLEGKDKEAVCRDWTIVRDFIKKIQEEYPENPQSQYPRISSELNGTRGKNGRKGKLTVLDTSPKWPNSPRFRFKRSFVTHFVKKLYGDSFEELPHDYSTYEEIEEKCHVLTNQYRGKTVGELCSLLNIKRNKQFSKSDAERIMVRMFDGRSIHVSQVDVFSRFGIKAKTIVLTKSGKHTEDMKLDSVTDSDWSALKVSCADFEDSAFYDCFKDTQFLCMVFEEPSHDAPFDDNVFLGFKWYSFSDDFIDSEVRHVWKRMNSLIADDKLAFVPQLKKDGTVRYNRNGFTRGAPNLPKAKDGIVFLRGTGENSDSKNKPLVINGVQMYHQNIWIKGAFIAGELKKEEYL